MKVRIDREDGTRTVASTDYVKGMFGRIKEIEREREVVAYNVLLYLDLSEHEKSVIAHNQLDEIVIEELAVDSSDQIADLQKRATACSNKYELDEIDYQIGELQKRHSFGMKLSMFMANPLRRFFDTPHEANAYVEKLKTSILPKIKQLIETNMDAQRSESFDL